VNGLTARISECGTRPGLVGAADVRGAIVGLNPIAENLFCETDDGVHLIGGRCSDCARVTFPARTRCGHCYGTSIVDELLPRRGTVWTWTTQSFLPKAPYAGPETEDDFAGFVVGYVDLPGACRVQARLDVPVDKAAQRAAIGTEMESVAIEFNVDEEGRPIHVYAFRPVTPAATHQEAHK
jgi:uncharacterized OB-fold protein